jgi:hypothetical protein
MFHSFNFAVKSRLYSPKVVKAVQVLMSIMYQREFVYINACCCTRENAITHYRLNFLNVDIRLHSAVELG